MTVNLNSNDDLELEQSMLRDTAADFVDSLLSLAVVRRLAKSESGVDEAIWKQISEMGWTGILVPEKYGGMGMRLGDMAIVMQEMARTAYQGPFCTAAVSSVLAIAESDNESFKETVFPQIVDGSLIFSFALDEGQDYRWSGFSTLATAAGNDYRISGTKLFVPYAHIADMLIVAANRGDDVGLFVVDPDQSGVTIKVLPTISGAKLCEVIFDKAPAQSLLGDTSKGAAIVEKVFHSSALVNCAEMVGGALSALTMTVDYVTQREQFGVPIGSFQAVQHKCADMLTWVDTARLLVHDGINEVDEGRGDLAESAAICKVWTGEVYKNTVKAAHQLMAGTGYMEEMDLHLYFRHAKVSELAFGTPDFYRDVLADRLEI
jgi:alkylation response protein AidB-like acyl-CoA dehydrogenase